MFVSLHAMYISHSLNILDNVYLSKDILYFWLCTSVLIMRLPKRGLCQLEAIHTTSIFLLQIVFSQGAILQTIQQTQLHMPHIIGRIISQSLNNNIQVSIACIFNQYWYSSIFLSRAGWKKDLSGKWIKDEDAEFDSDEDIPDLP